MTDSDIQRDIVGAIDAIGRMGSAQAALNQSFTEELNRIWDDNAALRDDLHALANRLEALTSFVVTSPTEVAEAMVKKHGVPCSECGVPVYVDHLDPELPSPIRNAADGTKHTCHVRAVPNG